MSYDLIRIDALVLDLTPAAPLEPMASSWCQHTNDVTLDAFRAVGWSDTDAAELMEIHQKIGGAK